MKTNGRPTVWNLDVQAKIIAAILAGNYKTVAAAAAGVHRDTINEWEHRGARGEEPFKSFSDALKEAEARAEINIIAEVRSGAENWQSRAWMAERRWPKRWAGRVRTAVSEELDSLLSRLQRRLDEDTFRKVIDASREDAPSDTTGDARH